MSRTKVQKQKQDQHTQSDKTNANGHPPANDDNLENQANNPNVNNSSDDSTDTNTLHKQNTTSTATTTNDHWYDLRNNRLYAERRYLDPLEQAVPFFYTMHSIWALVLAIVPILTVAFYCPPQTVDEATTKAIYLFLWLYLIVSCMIMPSGPFIRPHPIMWRIVFAISLLYMFILLIILILPNEYVLTKLIPVLLDTQKFKLGAPLILPDYATDCTLTVENFVGKLDRFVFAHFLGWLFKAVLLRNRFLLWSLSLIWELIELSLVYFVPNFGECWWDSYIMDFLVCNGLGIELGLLFCKWWAKYNKYHWSPLLNTNKVIDKLRSYCKGTLIMLFTPEKWRPTLWEPYHSVKRFLQVYMIMITMCIIDLNAFLLKLYLWIPTQHEINIIRVVLYWFVSMPAVRQYYFYVKDKNITRMGSQMWVLLVLMVLETAIVIKMTPVDMPVAPWTNIVAWIGSALLFLAFTYVMCCQVMKPKKQQ